MSEPINVKCPSCDQVFANADESDLMSRLERETRQEVEAIR
jgi:transcription initiation factor IIE alpha subunit